MERVVRNLAEIGRLTRLLLPVRMNKSRFEEDDGIDMNDIERFLPHLRSVSRNVFPSSFDEFQACFSDCAAGCLFWVLIHSLVGKQRPLLT